MSKTVTGSVMVVGGGIAGIQASLDLADSGYLVHMVEGKSAIGGVMAQLDKTFPTNDCAMCVISPKLVEAGRHLNIDLHTLTEVQEVTGEPGNFKVKLRKRPRYIDLDKCTACGECAKACPIDAANAFDQGLRDRKAAFKLYPQGMPSAYTIDKRGTAPCKATCPAHVSIQGYIALINDGRYAEALKLFKQDHPFPAVCGRVCHHPCEGECTRNDVDQPLAIRELHRFLADYEKQSGEFYVPEITAEKRPEKVAVIGSGPAGLTAAYELLQQGYGVTIFEKLPEPGGMMRVGIPEYRLPRDILADEIRVIQQMGAEIKCGVTFGKDITLDSLKTDGYAACFMAIGLHGGRKLGVENEDAAGVLQGVDFLRDAAMGKEVEIGEDVVVVGGGNVAIDVALTAKRKGAKNVTLICLEKREEMPAWEHEIEEALEGDIQIVNSFGPKAFFIDKSNKVSGIEFKTCTAVFDGDGRFNPQYDDNACQPYFGDTVIVAIGQSTDLTGITEQGIAISGPGGLQADPLTLQTPIDWVFAGGDAFYGPKSVVDAVACGKEAAESIHRFINGLDLTENREKVWEFVKPDIANEPLKKRTTVRCLDPQARECNFLEVSFGYDEAEAKSEAERCLKCGICSECYQCVDACLAEAIDHEMQEEIIEVEVGSVILAPGFKAFDPAPHLPYGYNHPNVVTSLEFERILSASGPYQGHLQRPSDGREPEKIAWLQCVGSRDINKCDNAYCSAVCCMYAAKQTVIAKEHANKELDTAVFYMDMRTYGKEFDRYYKRAQEEAGVRFVRSRVHTVDPVENDQLELRYMTEDGELKKETFDMVVLSVGLAPLDDAKELAQRIGVALNEHQFAATKALTPVSTNKPGIYVCGAFQAPKDIPQSVMEASAAAAAATSELASARGTLIRSKTLPPELDISGAEPRVGVFVCNCGINIGGVADVPAVREYARTLPYVVHVEDNLFTCSQDTQDKMKEVIKENNINRVVVASCSPRTHEPLFQETIREVGLNKYLFEMANIRDQNTWVHMGDPAGATEKAKDLVRMAVAKAAYIEPLHQVSLAIKKAAVVVGGGAAGMEAALGIARQGCQVHLVERNAQLGGNARKLNETWDGQAIAPYVENMVQQIENHPLINVMYKAEVVETTGILGSFTSSILHASESGVQSIAVEHGATVIATGGQEYQPTEFLYGQNPNVLTHLDLDAAMRDGDARLKEAGLAVFIQCVGSRTDENPSCSRVCCTHSLKSAIGMKKHNPDMTIAVLYRDIRSYGFREDLYKKARELGVIFVRFDLDNPPDLVQDDSQQMTLTVTDHILGRPLEMNPDLVVLAAGIRPTENRALFEAFKVPINAEGFLVEAHAKLRPVDFASEGIFMAGLAHYPKSLDETIAQAQATVARVMTILSKENIMVGGVVASVDPNRCAVCLTCVRACPYHVPYIGDEGYAIIEPAECHGCGICVSECPGKAIQLQHFTDEQIVAKTKALFQ